MFNFIINDIEFVSYNYSYLPLAISYQFYSDEIWINFRNVIKKFITEKNLINKIYLDFDKCSFILFRVETLAPSSFLIRKFEIDENYSINDFIDLVILYTLSNSCIYDDNKIYIIRHKSISKLTTFRTNLNINDFLVVEQTLEDEDGEEYEVVSITRISDEFVEKNNFGMFLDDLRKATHEVELNRCYYHSNDDSSVIFRRKLESD